VGTQDNLKQIMGVELIIKEIVKYNKVLDWLSETNIYNDGVLFNSNKHTRIVLETSH
jgi:hypothetical protein